MTILTPLRALCVLAVMWLLPIHEIAQARGPGGGGRRSGGSVTRGVMGGASGPSRLSGGVSGGVSGGRYTPSTPSIGGQRYNPSGTTPRSASDVQGFLSGTRATQAQQARPTQQARSGQHAANAQQAYGNFQNGPQPFSPAWYADHPTAWQHTHPHADAVAAASVGAVTGWLAHGAYPAAPVTSSSTVIYESSVPVADAPVTEEPASPGDATESDATGQDASEWLALGVYELSPPGADAATQLVQLSVDRQANVKGVYLDQLTGATQNVSGRVDEATQQVTWRIDNNPSAAFTTSLSDLTSPNGGVTVTLPSGPQAWTLKRSPGA